MARVQKALDSGEAAKKLAELAAFNKNVVLTPGNAGTLDMLNRGEIVYSGRPAELLASEDVKSRYLGVA